MSSPLTFFAVRRLFCLLLLICLPLQSFASHVSSMQPLGLAGMASHEIDRSDELHHHDDGGAIHYDGSEQSVAHADDHSAPVQFSALNRAAILFGLSPVSLADYPEPVSTIPEPCLDDPQRPPSFAPGLAAGG